MTTAELARAIRHLGRHVAPEGARSPDGRVLAASYLYRAATLLEGELAHGSESSRIREEHDAAPTRAELAHQPDAWFAGKRAQLRFSARSSTPGLRWVEVVARPPRRRAIAGVLWGRLIEPPRELVRFTRGEILAVRQ